MSFTAVSRFGSSPVRFGQQEQDYDSPGGRELVKAIRSLPRGTNHLVIGRERHGEPHLKIPQGTLITQSVSRRHGEIWKDTEGQLWYQDIGSSYGSGLNESKLDAHQPVQINEGDTLRLGEHYKLRF